MAEPASKLRGSLAREKELNGEISFIIVKNNGKREELELLTYMKNIVSKHLPNMQLDYISRIVYDPVYHEALLMMDNKTKIPFGGIVFRPFPHRGFIEVVFCAVESTVQKGGFGSYMMSHLKELVKERGIYHILTYADNQAIGYFMKQGFRKHVTLQKDKWQGYIKDYVSATLMECVLNENVESYVNVMETVRKQREALNSLITEVSPAHIHEGLTWFKEGHTKMRIEDIPGLKETGWRPDVN